MPQPKLHIKGKLGLTINPVIHSFIEYLPLGRVEFIETLNREVESNPMLKTGSEGEKAGEDGKNRDLNVIKEKLDRCDSTIMSRYQEDGFLRRSPDKMSKQRAIELFGSDDISLTDHLMQQARAVFDEEELTVAEYIIYSLSSTGYLKQEIATIASSIGSSPEEFERIRKEIMQFSPRGMAALSLRECLDAQVDEEEDPRLKALIQDHLHDLGDSNYEGIMKSMQISKEDLLSLIARVKHLNPKPGLLFSDESVDYADVDLILFKEGDAYTVRYVDEGIPRLALSQYYDRMYAKAKEKETRSYLKKKVRNANLFIEGIDLRRSMILSIARYLVKVQKDFLDYGEKWKKPLTMREVAEALDISESSVSRTVNGKYMASSKGIISLKSFFAHGFKNEYGLTHSVHTVRDKIRKMIEGEPRDKPYSDQVIADRMKELGITISRRTVRNYRDELGIDSSSKRRRKYSLEEK